MPLVCLGTGWLIGIALASALQLPLEILFAASLVPIAGLLLWRTDRRVRLIWLSVFAAILGGLRFALSVPHFDQNSLSTYNGLGVVTLEGVIAGPPDVRDTYINLRVNADRLTLSDRPSQPIDGVVLVRPSRPAEFHYGERVQVTGELNVPPEFATFNYADFLARQGVYSLIDRPRLSVLAKDQGSPVLAVIYGFRERAYRVLQQILPEPQSSLLSGILLGVDAGLPVLVQENFRNTGTTHIIAISGYNVTILISIMSAFAVRLFGRRRAFPILIVGLTAYTIMVGASASVVRAAIMGGVTLLAIYLGRQGAALISLFFAGWLMTFFDPNALFDVGFQLSFVATLGLVLYATPFTRASERLVTRLFDQAFARQAVGLIKDALLVTLAAQVTTFPLLMYYFRQISLISFVVNPLVLPAQTGVMMFGLFALTGGLVSIPLGQIAAWTVWPFLTWTLAVIELFAPLPFAAIPLDYVPPIVVAAYYAVLIGLTWYFKQSKEQRPTMIKKLITPRRALLAGGLGVLLLAVTFSWRPDERLHVYVLNVEGHPALVQTPTGHQILIGGSNSPSGLLSALGPLLPFWDRDIDLVVVPTGQGDQLNGLLAVLDRYAVKQIMSVEISPDSRAGQLDRLPTQPKLIFTWTPIVSDTRVIDLTNRGTLDLTFENGGVAIGEVR